MDQAGNAAAVIEAMERLGGVDLKTIEWGDDASASVLVVPKGKEVKSLKPFLDEYLAVPERKTGTTMLTTLADFGEFVNRHKTQDSIVFVNDANQAKPQMVAIFNPHKAQARTDEDKDVGPDWQDHRAVYNFPLSDEWVAWKAMPADGFSQVDFAIFLEDRIADVGLAKEGGAVARFAEELQLKLATPAQLLTLSKGLAITVDAKASQQVNLGSGEASLSFIEEHKDSAGAPLRVPGAFAIDIPVFRSGQPFQIPVRLRYRMNSGRVRWFLTPQKLDQVFEAAIAEAQQITITRTGLPVFRGAP